MSDFQIPLLSSLVGFLADIMRVCLEYAYKLTDDLGFPSYGIAIIVLTIIIKTALLPLAVKQIKSMKAMQEIQPLMQQVQKKYKNDPKKLREEMGKLYKEHGANPMSSGAKVWPSRTAPTSCLSFPPHPPSSFPGRPRRKTHRETRRPCFSSCLL